MFSGLSDSGVYTVGMAGLLNLARSALGDLLGRRHELAAIRDTQP